MLRVFTSRLKVILAGFLTLIFTSSCLTVKTIPTNKLKDFHSVRNIVKIHSEDSLWVIQQFQVDDNVLTGKLVRNTKSISALKAADIYVAPINVIKIKGDILTMPVGNIGKIEYSVLDPLMIISSIGVAFVIFLFSLRLYY